MTWRWPFVVLLSAGLPAGAIFPLIACSSSGGDGGPAPATSSDGGDAMSDGGGDGAPSDDPSEAGPVVPPPPYDFTVTCAGGPCATRIAARGGAHVCAVLQDGAVRCWGSNASGQLGTGSNAGGATVAFSATPRTVLGIASAKDVAATGDGTAGTTCVVSGTGEVSCFGSDAWGQLGRPGGDPQGVNPDPAPVEGVQAKAVTLTNTFALAIGTDDRLWSWGANDTYQLARVGDDAGSASVAAARADRVTGAVRSCAGTSKTGFAVAEDGSLLSWGGGAAEQLGRVTSLARDPLPSAIGVAGVITVASGAAHACALGGGRVHCWGENERGQLGTGRKADEWYPAVVALPDDVHPVALAAGGDNTCIIAADGGVHCWGANGSGQLGTLGGDLALPSRIGGLDEQAVSVAVMGDSICALLRSGSVACWGNNRVGQLGRGGRDSELHPQPRPAIFE